MVTKHRLAERTNVAMPRLVVALAAPLRHCKLLFGSLLVCVALLRQYVCVLLASIVVALLHGAALLLLKQNWRGPFVALECGMEHNDGYKLPAERTNVAIPRLVAALTSSLLEGKLFCSRLLVSSLRQCICVLLASFVVALLDGAALLLLVDAPRI